MGISHKSHGKRSDKETEMPMLKIFKDMMHKEKHDPEKTNLLKDKHVERRRKHYSGSRSKSGHKTIDSSSSERQKHVHTYKKDHQDTRKIEFDGCRTHSIPFQPEKRESWWFSRDHEVKNAAVTNNGEKANNPDVMIAEHDAKSKGDDTCSCVSCALKKIVSAEYACIVCIIILFVVSVIIAIMLVYRSVPCMSGDHPAKTFSKNTKAEERLKRKIDGRGWNFGSMKSWSNPFSRSQVPSFGSFKFQDMGLVDSENDLSKILDLDKMYDLQNSEQLREFYRKLVQTDVAIRNLKKSLIDSPNNADRYYFNNNGDLYSQNELNTQNSMNNKNGNTQNDLNFQNGLNSQTGLNIQNGFNSHNALNSQNSFNNQIGLNNQIDLIGQAGSKSNIDFNNIPDRIKRSLIHRPKVFYFKRRVQSTKPIKPIIENGKVVTKTTVTMTTNKKTNPRNKRFGNFNDSEGFVIEKNQVVIQYMPSPNRIVAKCSHAPKDSHSHEHQMKHPFYKNTQRLDELLDQFIDKRLPEFITDNFDINMMHEQKNKCKHPQTEEAVVVKNEEQTSASDKDIQSVQVEVPVEKRIVTEEPKNEVTENAKTENDAFENDFFEDSDGVDKKKDKSSTTAYDILLSVSTIINPVIKRTTYPTSVLVERVPNLRKLMQVDVNEDQGVGYEDFKEVLADDKDGHDDKDKETDRMKRSDESNAVTLDPEINHYPLGVHNPNWKGPMPLYPEELPQMIKQGPYTDNKVEISVHNVETAPEIDESEFSRNDVQYIEDYLNNGYEKLVDLAQAYSDYGVLNEKKESDGEKKTENKVEHKLEDRKVRMAIEDLKHGFKFEFRKSGIFERPKKGTDIAEGIRFELKPSTEATEKMKDDGSSELYKYLHKHVKFADVPPGHKPHKFEPFFSSSQAPSVHLNDFGIETPKLNELNKVTVSIGIEPQKINEKVTVGKTADPIENGIFYTVNKKRTLKSIESKNNLEDLNDGTTEMVDAFGNFESVMSKFKRDTSNALKNEANYINGSIATNSVKMDDKELKSNVTKGNDFFKRDIASDNMTLSDFFMLLSNWFSALDAAELTSKEIRGPEKIPREANLEKRNNSGTLTTDMSFPLYDSDMIENIGHRSRVLLSVEESNNTKEEDNTFKREDEKIVESFPSTKPLKKINNTNTIQVTTQPITREVAKENNTKNHIVKRQATNNNNLIFWNDLYDDEYGVKVDPLENSIRDIHTVNKKDLIKKSNSWIQDKVKTFTNKLNMGYFHRDGRRASRQAENNGRSLKRHTRSSEDDEDSDSSSKLDFKALTAKMKEVCKKTAQIVQQTKNVHVREENKEDHVASSLMQQLVRLMTDLVDFQVQERTCRKLPHDLQKFLEWLTSKSEEKTIPEPDSQETSDSEMRDIDFDKPTEHEKELLPSERENADSRTDCLGTLHVVQDLIQQYDNMSDDDKQSIMPGVKTYLENQMDFLQRQISLIDEQNSSNKDARFRRGAVTEIGQKVADAIDVTTQTVEHKYKNLKKLYHKYRNKWKNTTKKIAETTASAKEALTTIGKKIMHTTKPKHTHKKFHKIKEKVKEENEKINTKDLFDEIKKTTVHQKNHYHFKEIFRDKDHIKEKNHVKDKIHERIKDHLKDNVNGKDKGFVTSEDGLEDVQLKDKEDSSQNRDERNIKDVYFKALEEAKKESTIKNNHKRDDEMFDKTEILRIND